MHCETLNQFDFYMLSLKGRVNRIGADSDLVELTLFRALVFGVAFSNTSDPDLEEMKDPGP